jgi:hypothetical protein
MSIESKLRNLEKVIGRAEPKDRIPFCMCGGQINGGKIVEIAAADYLAGKTPEMLCSSCGKELCTIIIVSTHDEVLALKALDETDNKCVSTASGDK